MRSSVARWVAVALVAAGALAVQPSAGHCTATDATAQTTPPAAGSVEISFAGSDRARSKLEEAIAPLLRGDSRISFLRSPAEEIDRPPPGVARVRVDATGDGVVAVIAFIAERPPAARSIEARGLDPVTTEVVAQIVGATAKAILDGEPAGAGDSPPVATVPTPFVPPAAVASPTAVASASSVAAGPVRARAVVVSAGYLLRSVFESGTPLAQGFVARVSAFPTSTWRTTRPFMAFTFEYHKVHVPELSRGVSALDLDYEGGAGHAVLGVSGRPLRFVELGVGLGIGVMYTVAGNSDFTRAVLPVGRVLFSVAAVGLPTGLELTLALTVDGVPHGGYEPATAAIYPPFEYPTPSWIQPGALLTLGWRATRVRGGPDTLWVTGTGE